MVTVFLADGFEEIEAVTPIDILRRGGVEVRTCSITATRTVTGAHGVPFVADTTLEALEGAEDLILLPGGMPGTLHLKLCRPLTDRILAHYQKGGRLAAICAAPTVFGALGILKSHEATCYPGMEGELFAERVSQKAVVVSENVVTSRGAGTAAAFGFCLLALLKGEKEARSLARTMCFEGDVL